MNTFTSEQLSHIKQSLSSFEDDIKALQDFDGKCLFKIDEDCDWDLPYMILDKDSVRKMLDYTGIIFESNYISAEQFLMTPEKMQEFFDEAVADQKIRKLHTPREFPWSLDNNSFTLKELLKIATSPRGCLCSRV